MSVLGGAEVVIHEPVRLRGGEEADFYVDIKKAIGSPELLSMMAIALAEDIDPSTTCVAASGHGGIPLGAAVSGVMQIPLVLVRDSEKKHGRRGVIDGYVPGSGDVVSLVDDVFTSGSSLRQTAANVSRTGAEVIGCHVVVARGDVSDFEPPVSYLFTPEDITKR